MRKPISILLAIAMLLSVLSALTFTVSAEDEEEFTAVNLSLGYNIGMTYYTNVDYASDVTAHVTINERTDTVKATSSAGKASFSFSGIAPHELGATITAEVYKGNTATGVTQETTVKDICALYLDNPFSEYVAETKAGIYKLVSNLLQYGEYARIYKGVSGSITSGITSANYTPDTLSTPAGTLTTVESNPSLSLRGLSVFFDTTNRYYIKFSTTDISKVRFTVDSTTYTEFGEEGGYYFFYTNPMSAKDTNNVVSIKGYYDNTKTIDLNYSIEQYIVDLAAVSASEGMRNLAKAIYNYCDSAESYTHLNFETTENNDDPPVVNTQNTIVYRHDIRYTDMTFGDNRNCSLTFYSTWSDNKSNTISCFDGFSEQELRNILGMYTDQRTYVLGFNTYQSLSINQSLKKGGGPAGPEPPSGTITFDTIPNVTPWNNYYDYQAFQFTISGTVAGTYSSCDFQNCSIISDTVTECIVFYIQDNLSAIKPTYTAYFAEEGMSWSEWIESEYNHKGNVYETGTSVAQVCGAQGDYFLLNAEKDIITSHEEITTGYYDNGPIVPGTGGQGN